MHVFFKLQLREWESCFETEKGCSARTICKLAASQQQSTYVGCIMKFVLLACRIASEASLDAWRVLLLLAFQKGYHPPVEGGSNFRPYRATSSWLRCEQHPPPAIDASNGLILSLIPCAFQPAGELPTGS